MHAELLWTPQAEEDLLDIYYFIAVGDCICRAAALNGVSYSFLLFGGRKGGIGQIRKTAPYSCNVQRCGGASSCMRRTLKEEWRLNERKKMH